MAIAFGT